jgi:hypothetical protein
MGSKRTGTLRRFSALATAGILVALMSAHADASDSSYEISVVLLEPYVTSDSPVEKYRLLETRAEAPIRIDLFRVSKDRLLKVDTATTTTASYQNLGLPEGEYLLQVIAAGFLPEKRRFHLKSNYKLSIRLRRPIDYGSGPPPSGGSGKGAGSPYAAGRIAVSLIFVQWSEQSTWTSSLRQLAIDAAEDGMSDFQAQAPAGAGFHSIVENAGTYTVTSPIGNECVEADLWVDEVLLAMGYSSGLLNDRLSDLAEDRRTAIYGTSSYCQICDRSSSGFLFFVTREPPDPDDVGGWNCSGRYQITYFGRSDEPVIYVHEIGHAFGTMDEYCTEFQSLGWYCCGWVGGPGGWGCNATDGCLQTQNDNCDPLCGEDCDDGPGFLDCQDGCPQWNCENHITCAMDGGSSTNFCPSSRLHLGWQDSDGDSYLNCLENGCGTNPNDPTSFPDCRPFNDVYVDGNWIGPELGTFASPYRTVAAGYQAAIPGDVLHIKNGPFNETPVLDKEVRLEKWGLDASIVIGTD